MDRRHRAAIYEDEGIRGLCMHLCLLWVWIAYPGNSSSKSTSAVARLRRDAAKATRGAATSRRRLSMAATNNAHIHSQHQTVQMNKKCSRTRISQIAIAYIFSSISDPAWPSEQSVRRKRVINIIIIPTMPSHRRENTQSGSTPSSLRTPPYRPGNTRHAYNTPAVYAGSAPRGLSKPRRSEAGLNVQAMAARQRGSTT